MSHHQSPAIFISLTVHVHSPNTYSRCYSTQLLLHLPYRGVDISRCFFILYLDSMGSHLSSDFWGQCCSVRRGWINFRAQFDRLNWQCLVVPSKCGTFSQFDGMNLHLNSKIHRNLLENDWRDLFKQAFAVKIKNLSALTLLLWYLWKFEMVLLLISILLSPLD